MLGQPLYETQQQRDGLRFVLLKRITRRPFEGESPGITDKYLKFDEGPNLVVVMLIWVSGSSAERLALAIMDEAIWEQADPTMEHFGLL